MLHFQNSFIVSFEDVEDVGHWIQKAAQQVAAGTQDTKRLLPDWPHLRHEKVGHRVDDQVEAAIGQLRQITHVALQCVDRQSVAFSNEAVLVKLRRRLPARPEAGLPEFSLLEVTIKTGRTHQIRVHLASQGHPIAGDDKYGDFERNKALQKQGLKRMFLHAWRLQFTHPAGGARVELHAPLPPDLLSFSKHSPQAA